MGMPCTSRHTSKLVIWSPSKHALLQGNYTGYMHLHCALKEAHQQNVELQPPVCKHWSRRGYCLYKDKCFYQHPLDALPPKADPVNTGNHNTTTNQAQRISNRGVGRRNLVRNAFRAGVFRRFLIDTFGRELLHHGSGVLDIAGGKGELSFELVNLNNIQATVVEPRPLQLWRQHKWLLKGFYHRNVNFQSYVDRKHQDFTSGSRACVDPPHLRMVFDEAVVNSLAPCPAAAQGPAAHDAQPCRGGPTVNPASSTQDANAQNDSTLLSQCWESDAAATANAAGADAEVAAGTCSKAGQHQDRSLHCHSETELSSAAPATTVHEADSAWQAVLQRSMQLAQDTRWTHKGLQHEDGQAWAGAETDIFEHAEPDKQELQTDMAVCGMSGPNEVDKSVGSTDVLDLELARSIIQNCSVIVGIHPDQAAEPIIDFAQRTGRPFAMVPCCVYPMEFPRRRLPDGTWVRKYEQLIEYLTSRDPHHIKVATLPFEGRNQVVYCTSWKD
ncbi:hypothetical protein ABBQ38_004237 [Trebouxia sp. C0009 RCD-2024]